MSDVYGAAAEILADFDTRRVIVRYLHPETNDMVMEVHLTPDIARDLAFTLTRASYALDDEE